MSTGNTLDPVVANVSSTLLVPVSEVNVLASFGHVLLVVGILLGLIVCANLLVLGLGKPSWNIGVRPEGTGLELLTIEESKIIKALDTFHAIEENTNASNATGTYVLLGARSVRVNVGVRCEQIHAEDFVEERRLFGCLC